MKKMRRALVIWKKDEERIFIMSKQGIFLLNERASRIWESLDGKSPGSLEGSSHLISDLLSAKLIEVLDE